jgi:branched-chain amino acid transport system substrate-binding protein
MKRGMLALGLLLAAAGCEKKTTPETSGSARTTASPDKKAPDVAPDAKAPDAKPAEGNTIVIGEVGAMTGDIATFGQSTHRGIMLALKELNAAGGVKGKQFEVKSLDDASKSDEAATSTLRLISQDHVSLILGEVSSTNSKFMAPIAQKNQVPMISPASTNPDVTKLGDYIFRVCFIDPFQGTVMAKFARDTLKVTKVAVLTDARNDYSKGLTQFFSETFTKAGGTIVLQASYSAGDPDFKAQLTQIRGLAPEAIYVPGYYNDVGLIARQARELGITVPLMGGDGWTGNPELYSLGGKALNGSYWSNHYSTQDPSPRIQKFIATYKEAYGQEPDAMAALGYDAMRVAAEAFGRAKDLTGPSVRDAIAATKDFDGVTGKITLDADRNAVKPAVVLKVEDGKSIYQTTIAP